MKNKIIISLALSALMIFVGASSARAAESDWQNLNPGFESGLTGTAHNCSTLTVTNGTVAAYPACTITCSSGYSLSGSSCLADSHGGGGGGISNPVPNNYLGCTSNVGFSTTTGKTCVGYVASTTPTSIPGCGSRTTGFSTATGQSCIGNSVTSPAIPSGGSNAGGNSNLANMPAGGGSTYNFGTAVLKLGSRGEAVKELQRFLNRFLNLGLVVDGQLGPKTIAVIKQWQKNNGLVADGLIGALTKAKMNAMALAQ